MRLGDGAPAAELGLRAHTALPSSSDWRRTGGLLGVGLVMLAALAARPAQAAVTLRDDRGVTVRLAHTPQRIVSLLPSLTESVCALGACARLVATDRFSNWPARVLALPKVGGMEDAQVERIVALRPDVVLVSSSARATGRLEGLGLAVIALESRNHADALRTLTLLGELLDARAQAVRVAADIERETRAAAARVPAALRGKRVYFEVDATPYAAGPESFIGETLGRLGLANIVPAALGPFPKLNPEYVVRAQPDIVMAPEKGLAELSRRPGWQALRALADGHACGFTTARADLLVRPGPRMGEAAQVLADCLVVIAKAPR
jgi:iron complex transport system substrate-binding protein